MRALLRDANAVGRSVVLVSLACIATGLAFAQSLELPNRRDVVEGITAAGQPSAAALEAAAKAGYKSVIDLRVPTEDRGFDEKSTVERLGMSYVSVPVDGAAGVTFANAGQLDKLLAELPKPILLHCSTGNRVGALLALRAKAGGMDDRAALELGVANGLGGLKSTVEQKLATGRD